MSKRKTMAQRREEFMRELNRLCVHTDKAGYLQGCRAANPAKYDTDDMRRRESIAHNNMNDATAQCIKLFNAAVRAAGSRVNTNHPMTTTEKEAIDVQAYAIGNTVDQMIREIRYDLTGDQMRAMSEVDDAKLRETLRHLCTEIVALRKDNEDLREQNATQAKGLKELSGVHEIARRRHPDGYNILDFMQVWLDQERSARQKQDTELHQLRERCARESCREQRDHRQLSVQIWVRDTFGERTAVSVDLRAARFIEEAIEAVQSAGLPLAELERVARFVYAKPAGELRQEIGGVGLTLLAFAAAAGVSADDAESAEFARVLAKGAEHFRQRDQLKADAGLFSQLSAEVPHD